MLAKSLGTYGYLGRCPNLHLREAKPAGGNSQFERPKEPHTTLHAKPTDLLLPHATEKASFMWR
eukprot:15436115-Alexandrium_andersonii.AAC.1